MNIKKKKILVILSDGVSLRNFVYSSFLKVAEEENLEIKFLNQTSLDLKSFGLKEIRCKEKPLAKSDLYKRARKLVELDNFQKQFNDDVYECYKFYPSKKGFKNKIKNSVVAYFKKKYKGFDGVNKLREKIKWSERSSKLYAECSSILKNENPEVVLSTSQRALTAIAPVLAAQDLGISTASFIFSWDNIPKATTIVEPDFYFVWSDFMAKQLTSYHPYISSSQIHVTGTPQFDNHFNPALRKSREEFFKEFGLDPQLQYLCFSGDDVTTSPHDPIYLRDTAIAVRQLNIENDTYRIIFRRCPVDWSDRFDSILEEYKDVLVAIDPAWKSIGKHWNMVFPTVQDLALQTNIIAHSFMVINVGSSMVFDYACYDKPCAFINYNPVDVELKKDIHKIYNYVHFRSMPKKESVFWIDNAALIKEIIQNANSTDKNEVVDAANQWFNLICEFPPNQSAARICKALKEI